jgi:hypothetical protein
MFGGYRLVLAVLVFLAVARILPAETLEGRVFLGPGLGLYLEKDEGLFQEMLRALSLVSGEVPVVNLTALAISRSHLFLAEDHRVYVRDEEDGEIHPVGSWKTARKITLDSGVHLQVTRSSSQIFEGQLQESLHVQVEGDLEVAEEGVVPASFGFWMDRLGEIYYPGAMTKGEEAEVALLIQALVGALPCDSSPGAEEAENIKTFRQWVGTHRFDNPEATELVLAGVLAKVRGEGHFQRESLDSGELQAVEALESFYLGIREVAAGN